MRRVSDRIFLSIIIFLTIFFWTLYFTRSWWQSGIIAVAVTVLVNLIWIMISGRIDKSRSLSRIEVFKLLAVMGTAESTAVFYKSLPVNLVSDFAPPTFIVDGETLVYNNIKFTPTTEEDIAKLYRACKSKGLSKAIFISARTDRKLMSFAAYLGISVTFPDRYYIKRYLARHNALPVPPDPIKVKLPRFKFKEMYPLIFDRRKVKYYLFSGIMLLLMSLITPLRLYYLIFASVPILFAIVSLLVKE